MHDLMRLNLQFFSADTGGEGGEGGTGGGADWVDSYLTKVEDTVTKEKDVMIPKKRFDDINSKFKALDEEYKKGKESYDSMAKLVKAAEKEKEESAAQFTATSARVEALEGILGNMLNAELEQIDEEYRELVPADKPIEQQLEWLSKAKAKGLFVSKGIDFEIGGMSNPKSGGKPPSQQGYKNMSPLQMMQMGYSSK